VTTIFVDSAIRVLVHIIMYTHLVAILPSDGPE
jgi:hypothetical protein